MFVAIPSWVAANAQGPVAVAQVVAAATLPWALKFLLGALVDRYGFAAMGRRRPWLIGAQALIIVTLPGFAILAPEPGDQALILAFILLLSSLAALQDAALDAMVIDLTPQAERGRINAAMFAGKVTGMAGGAGITGLLLEYAGFGPAMIAMAALFALPALLAVLVRERSGERLLPWTHGEAAANPAMTSKTPRYRTIMRDALASLRHRDMALMVLFSLLTGVKSGFINVAGPVFAIKRLGWNEGDYGILIGGNSLFGGVLAIVFGGWAIDRFGARPIALSTTAFGTAALAALISGGALLAR